MSYIDNNKDNIYEYIPDFDELNREYLEYCREYHEKYPKEQLRNIIDNFNSKLEIIGINSQYKFKILADKILLAGLGISDEKLVIPDFVFGIITEEDKPTFYNFYANGEVPENLSLTFNRPLVRIDFLKANCFGWIQETEELKHILSADIRSVNSYRDIGLFSYLQVKGKFELINFDTRFMFSMSNMFSRMTETVELDLGEKFNTEHVLNMRKIFGGLRSLKELNLPKEFNTQNVRNMHGIFSNCDMLSKIDFSKCNFDTRKCENFGAMFCGCNGLKSLDLSMMNTKNAKTMSNMFNECNSLKRLNLGNNFYTDKVENMSEMFCGCSELEELDLGDKFDTRKCSIFDKMFSACTRMKRLRLGNLFRIPDGATMKNMLMGFYQLEYIDFGDSWRIGNNMANRSEMNRFIIASTKLKRIKVRGKEYSLSGHIVDIISELVRM